MADLAFVFHWSYGELMTMPLPELVAWHGRIEERLRAMPMGLGI